MAQLVVEFDARDAQPKAEAAAKSFGTLADSLDRVDSSVSAAEKSFRSSTDVISKNGEQAARASVAFQERARAEREASDLRLRKEKEIAEAEAQVRQTARRAEEQAARVSYELRQKEIRDRNRAVGEAKVLAAEQRDAEIQAQNEASRKRIELLRKEDAARAARLQDEHKFRGVRDSLREEALHHEALAAAQRKGTAAVREFHREKLSANAQLKAGAKLHSDEARQIDHWASRLHKAKTEVSEFRRESNAMGSYFSGQLKSWALGFVSIAAAISLVRSALRGIQESSARFGTIETALVSVQKTTELTNAGLKEFYSDILRLSTGAVPVATEKLLEYAKVSGQIGVKGRNDLLAYTETLARLAQTTNIVGEQGAESLGRLMETQSELPAEVSRTGSALAYMDANSKATATDILHMATQVGRATGAFKVGSPAAIGLGAALVSMGAQAEAASSVVGHTMRDMQMAVYKGGTELSNFAKVAGVSANELKAAFDKSPLEAFLLVLKGAGTYGKDSTIVFDKLGLAGERMAKNLPLLASKYDMVEESIRQASVAAEENIYLTEKSSIAFDTQESRAQRLDNTVLELKRNLGEGLAPALEEVNKALVDMAKDRAIIDFFYAVGRAIGFAMKAYNDFYGPLASFVTGGLRAGRVASGEGTTEEIKRRIDELIFASAQVRGEIQRMEKLAVGDNKGVATAAAAALPKKRKELADQELVILHYQAMHTAKLMEEGSLIDENAGKAEAKASSAAAAEDDARQSRLDELQDAEEVNKAERQRHSQLEQVERATIKIRDAEAEVLAVRAEAAALKLPIEDQIRLNREREVERRILDDSLALRKLIADSDTKPEVRTLALKRLEELKTATLGQVVAEEALAAAVSVDELERQEQAFIGIANAHVLGAREAQKQEIAEERLREERELLLRTGGSEEALAQRRRTWAAEETRIANERISGMAREGEILEASIALELRGRDAIIAAEREERIRQATLEKMVGLGDKWNASMEKSVKLLEDYRDAQVAARAVGDLQSEAGFARRLTGINQSDPRLRELEEQYLTFLRNLGQGSIEEGERMVALNQAMLSKMGLGFMSVVGMIRTSLEDLQMAALARQQQGAGLTGYERYRIALRQEEDVAAARIKFGEDAVTVTKDATAKQREININHWSGVLSDTQAVLGQLANTFGGFFNYLSRAAGVLQQAMSSYSSTSSLVDSLGGSAGLASSAGAFGAYLAIVTAAVDAFNAHAESRRARKYDYAATLAYDENDGFLFSSNVTAATRDLARQIAETAEAFAEAIGGTITSLASIELTIRKDGEYYQARIGDTLLTSFRSYEEALSAAIVHAFSDPSTSLRGLSDLVRQGMEEIFSSGEFQMGSIGSEETLDLLETLREIVELDWSGTAKATLEEVRHLDNLRETLSRLGELTPAVQAGLDGIVAAEGRAWQSWRDSITGREQSAAEQLKAKQQEAELYNAQRELRIAELQFQRAMLIAERDHVRTNAELGRARLGLEGEILRGYGGMASARAELAEQEIASLEGYLNAKSAGVQAEAGLNQTMTDLMAARLAALSNLINVLDNIGPIDLGEIRLPGGGGGGRRQQRESLEDELRGVIRDAMPELSRALLEGRERIAEFEAEIARLGPDAKLAAEALAILRENLGQDIRDEIAEVLSGASDWGRQRQDIIDHWQEVRDAVQEHLDETGVQLASFFEITEAEARQLADITQELLGSLGVPYFDLQQRMLDFDATMADLFQAFEDGSIDATQLMIAVEAMGDQIYATLLGGMAQYIQDSKVREQVEHSLRELEYDAKKAIWAAEIEFYRLRGQLTQEEYDFLQGVLRGLPADLPWVPSGGTTIGDNNNSGSNIMEERANFADRLRDILELDLSPIEREYRQLQREIAELMAEGARLGFSTAELMRAEQALIRDFWRGVTEPIRDFYDSLNLSELSPLTDAQRFAEAQQEAFATVAAAGRGDLEAIQDLPSILRDYLEAAGENFGTAGSGYGDIFAWVQEILRRFSEYSGGSVQLPLLPGSTNLVPFPRQNAPAQNQPPAQDRRLLDATLQQNAILREMLGAQRRFSDDMRLSAKLRKDAA